MKGAMKRAKKTAGPSRAELTKIARLYRAWHVAAYAADGPDDHVRRLPSFATIVRRLKREAALLNAAVDAAEHPFASNSARVLASLRTDHPDLQYLDVEVNQFGAALQVAGNPEQLAAIASREKVREAAGNADRERRDAYWAARDKEVGVHHSVVFLFDALLKTVMEQPAEVRERAIRYITDRLAQPADGDTEKALQ